MSVYHEGGKLLRTTAKEPTVVDMDTVRADGDTTKDVTVDEVIAQVHAALMALTANEAPCLVLGAGSGAGLEARRRLHLRYDLRTAGRSRGLLPTYVGSIQEFGPVFAAQHSET